MHRNDFFPKRLNYLASFDVQPASDHATNEKHDVSYASNLSRRSFNQAKFHADGPSRVYNAVDEQFVFGEAAIEGYVRSLSEQLEISTSVGRVTGRAVLSVGTEQERRGDLSPRSGLIDVTYEGTLRPYFHGQWSLIWVADAPPIETKAFVNARFETTNTKYQWLTGLQCVGYGRLWIQDRSPIRVSLDFYYLGMEVLPINVA